MTDKERLLRVLEGETLDRPPVICPGGMMNMCTTDLMDLAHVSWPEAHTNAEMMADLAQMNYTSGSFDNVGVPFCMTVEAENMGAQVTMGSREFEPRVTGYAFFDVADWEQCPPFDLGKGRAKVVLDAIKILKERNLDAAIVGNITGPISTASSVMDPVPFYKQMRKKRELMHDYLEYTTKETIKFAYAMIDAGADLIAVSDPSGTGEILGPKLFEEYAVKYLNEIADAVHARGVKILVHICGHMDNVYAQADMIRSDALSFDSCVSMRALRENLSPDRVIMGNVSTWALEFATPEKVAALAATSRNNGSNIIAPACGIGSKSPLATVKAMRDQMIADAE